MNWQPTPEEIEEKLIEMAYRWGDIESELMQGSYTEYKRGGDSEYTALSAWVDSAFRVEAVFGNNSRNDPCSFYVLLYDVAEEGAREAKNLLEQHDRQLRALITERARPWHTHDFLILRAVARSTPVEGEICRRLGESHPATVTPSLDDVPTFIPTGSAVPLEKRGQYYLTPIEAPFYDALAETGLTFSVQPWIQHTDRKYRVDFLVHYGGGVISVELDGHEFHKTKEQRGDDAAKDRWLQARGVRTVRFTGTQIYADVQGCIRELLDVVRQSQARP